MTLDERITEISQRLLRHLGMAKCDEAEIDAIAKAACYAAIRAFAEQEPSEGMMDDGAEAFLLKKATHFALQFTIPAAYRAMMQAAIKELP